MKEKMKKLNAFKTIKALALYTHTHTHTHTHTCTFKRQKTKKYTRVEKKKNNLYKDVI